MTALGGANGATGGVTTGTHGGLGGGASNVLPMALRRRMSLAEVSPAPGASAHTGHDPRRPTRSVNDATAGVRRGGREPGIHGPAAA